MNLYCDGGVLGQNPSPHGVYWSLGVEKQWGLETKVRESEYYSTNNEAEWLALIEALAWAKKNKTSVVIHSDSKLVVRQYNGQYKCRAKHLKILRDNAWDIRDQAEHDIEVVWVPRKEIFKRLGH